MLSCGISFSYFRVGCVGSERAARERAWDSAPGSDARSRPLRPSRSQAVHAVCTQALCSLGHAHGGWCIARIAVGSKYCIASRGRVLYR